MSTEETVQEEESSRDVARGGIRELLFVVGVSLENLKRSVSWIAIATLFAGILASLGAIEVAHAIDDYTEQSELNARAQQQVSAEPLCAHQPLSASVRVVHPDGSESTTSTSPFETDLFRAIIVGYTGAIRTAYNGDYQINPGLQEPGLVIDYDHCWLFVDEGAPPATVDGETIDLATTPNVTG